MTAPNTVSNRTAEAARLVREIDAWRYAVPFESGDEYTDLMWSNARDMFHMAIEISMWARERDLFLFVGQSDGIRNTVRTLCDMGYDTLQKRNGYELWQAFLAVSHFGRVANAPCSDTVIVEAMACARLCLRARVRTAGFMPWDLPPAVVVQVAELDYLDDPFARDCLQSMVARAKSSYGLALEAREVLVRTLKSIDDDFIGNGNQQRMQRVLVTITQGIADVEARVVAVVQGLHTRLGERSLVMGLGKDLVSKVVGLVKEG